MQILSALNLLATVTILISNSLKLIFFGSATDEKL